MAGRRPKPTELKKLQGNPGKRALNKAEPKPKPKRPSCPKHLTGEARKEWNRITKQLLALDLLTQLDRAALAAYCVAWARWVEAEQEMQKPNFKMIQVTDKGYAHVSPWFGVANSALKQMRAFLSEFGLTPASRSKVTSSEPPEADPYEQFLHRRNGVSGE